MLPNFLVIGAAKSGTTSLYRYLGEHPEVYTSPVKEPGFFAFEDSDLDFRGPLDGWMKPSVATTRSKYESYFEDVTVEKAVGESSPAYLYYPHAPARIKRLIPDVRLIALLRNPVERAHSQFLFFIQCNREPLWHFEEALAEEDRRVAENWAWGWHYKRLGFYYEQLRRYFDLFDRSQIKVYLNEDLRFNPADLMRDVYAYLGVDAGFQPDVSRRHNVTFVPRNETVFKWLKRPNAVKSALRVITPPEVRRSIRKTPVIRKMMNQRRSVSPVVSQRLTEVYRDDILRLQDLIDRDLSAWLK